jgi:hypothetical protein
VKEAIKYIPQSVSMRNLLDTWIKTFCSDKFVIALHNPKKHSKILKKLGISDQLKGLHEAEFITCIFETLEEAKNIFAVLCDNEGLFCSLYALNNFITDSIDETIRRSLENEK